MCECECRSYQGRAHGADSPSRCLTHRLTPAPRRPLISRVCNRKCPPQLPLKVHVSHRQRCGQASSGTASPAALSLPSAALPPPGPTGTPSNLTPVTPFGTLHVPGGATSQVARASPPGERESGGLTGVARAACPECRDPGGSASGQPPGAGLGLVPLPQLDTVRRFKC